MQASDTEGPTAQELEQGQLMAEKQKEKYFISSTLITADPGRIGPYRA